MLHEPTGFEPLYDSTCEIPLYDRNGVVLARARVDPDDWFAFARYRWSLNQNGYAVGSLSPCRFKRNGRRGKRAEGPRRSNTLLHRAIMGFAIGDPREVDHINRDRLDCRPANLRVADRHVQGQNQTAQKGRTSPYRGVSWDKVNQKWIAQGKINGRQHNLGRFAIEEDAAAAASAFRAEHMPFSEEGMAARRALGH
jgi:hypothetical protein